MSDCGIYAFEVVSGNPNKIGWKYIGQSLDIRDRRNQHMHKLRNRRHVNRKLQKYFDKYGEGALEFYNLDRGSINHVLLKNKKHHKGWTIYEGEE